MTDKIIFNLDAVAPFPFVKRYRLSDKDGRYIATFRKVEDFQYFVKYVLKHRKRVKR